MQKHAELVVRPLFFSLFLFFDSICVIIRSIILRAQSDHRYLMLNLNILMLLIRTVIIVVAAIFLLNLIILELNYLVVKSIGSPLLLAILTLNIWRIVSAVGKGSAERNLLGQADVMYKAFIASPLIVQFRYLSIYYYNYSKN